MYGTARASKQAARPAETVRRPLRRRGLRLKLGEKRKRREKRLEGRRASRQQVTLIEALDSFDVLNEDAPNGTVHSQCIRSILRDTRIQSNSCRQQAPAQSTICGTHWRSTAEERPANLYCLSMVDLDNDYQVLTVIFSHVRADAVPSLRMSSTPCLQTCMTLFKAKHCLGGS
ncbi:hypothetical protein PHSY_001291 [Pseudozyma hubeiensis SY62]|uniref:Uncharacterized protein n=1 Tax=Pseudozyma hubeiensis (strain SY62) TaxID=1305764 RepID=R9NYH2_PSEHS|nr:hypothetical protein PHSY_001291 [Pseudozyma hubeiensis SY62]GAC93726.1 hypothetical protein PHSY_001291 [Pseudozyma hubeiensis SY62]